MPVEPPKDRWPAHFLAMGEGEYFSPFAFLVDKSTRTLSIWKRSADGLPQLVSYHASDMGKREGDKFISGDHKTPLGIYFFQKILKDDELNFNEYGSRAFTMDYPNYFDRRERKTGHGIWLHAIPETKSLKRGSRGCVVIRNEVIRSLESLVSPKMTPIIVADKVQYITRKEFSSFQQKLNDLMNQWKKSWVDKDIDRYISFYHNKFRSLKMNKEQWKHYKTELNTTYEFIKVDTQNPTINVSEDEAIIRFLQTYRSDKVEDFGEKTLYLKKNDDGEFKIIGEKWQAINNQKLAQKYLPNEPQL